MCGAGRRGAEVARRWRWLGSVGTGTASWRRVDKEAMEAYTVGSEVRESGEVGHKCRCLGPTKCVSVLYPLHRFVMSVHVPICPDPTIPDRSYSACSSSSGMVRYRTLVLERVRMAENCGRARHSLLTCQPSTAKDRAGATPGSARAGTVDRPGQHHLEGSDACSDGARRRERERWGVCSW
jgi:hypothetical protein